jgi:hypothetical protein
MPRLADKIPEGKRKTRFLNALQDYKYNEGSLREAENALAWALGFNIVQD